MTALEELIKRIEAKQQYYINLAKENKKLKKEVDAILTATTLILMNAKSLLELEKQQIINAVDEHRNLNGEEYYKAVYENTNHKVFMKYPTQDSSSYNSWCKKQG